MLSIRIGQQRLPLPKDFRLGFSLVTNVLNIADLIDPSFTLPISLPMNEVVGKAFGYAYQPQQAFDLSQVFDNCAILLNNNDHWLGAIELADIDDKHAKINFRFASGYIPTVNKSSKLRDFFNEQMIRITGDSRNIYTIIWPLEALQDRYEISVNGIVYAQDKSGLSDSIGFYLEALAQSINHLDVLSAEYTNDTFFRKIIVSSSDNTALTVLASHTLAGLKTDIYLDLDTEFFFSAFEGQGTIFELPPMYMPGLYNGQADNYQGFVNTHEVGGFYKIPQLLEDIELSIVPCIKTTWLVKTLFASFGIEATGDYLTDPELCQRLEFVPRTIDKEVFESDVTEGLDVSIPVSAFLPDITVSDFLKSIKAECCMSITFDSNSKSVSLNLLENLLKDQAYEDWSVYLSEMGAGRAVKYEGMRMGFQLDNNDQEVKALAKPLKTFERSAPVADLTALGNLAAPALGEIRMVESKNAFYQYALRRVDEVNVLNWDVYAYNLDDNVDPDEQFDVRSIYSPLVDVDQAFEGRDMRMPMADVVGFLPSISLDDDQYSLRFTIYRGLQKDLQNNDYKMASVGIHRIDESAIVGAEKVFAPGEHSSSLKIRQFSEFQKIMENNIEFSASLRLPAKVLQGFKPTTKKRIDGVNYLILSLHGEFTSSGVSLVNAVLQKVT